MIVIVEDFAKNGGKKMGHLKKIPINIVAEGSQAIDNLAEIDRHFIKVYDITGRKFAGGWCYKCRHCGAYSFCVETWFECQKKFIVEKLTCSNWECLKKTNSRWRLEITPLNDSFFLNLGGKNENNEEVRNLQ